jgi:hypothetical protein
MLPLGQMPVSAFSICSQLGTDVAFGFAMAMTLDQARELVRNVVRDRKIDAEVVGATASEGKSDYAEVLVILAPDARRVSVGVVRNSDPTTLRRQVTQQLNAAARRPGATF